MVTIRVKLFAMLRERAGGGDFVLDLPAASTAREALAAIGQSKGMTDLLERMPVALAVNREYIRDDVTLVDGDELAVIPPVSGGAPEAGEPLVHAAIVAQPVSADRLERLVANDGAGAIVTFHGTTRTVDRLEYEAYDEMARERLAAILAEVAAAHGLLAAAAEHRTGAVPLGESSVVVAVSAAHRPEAFAGAREAIDRIKSELPVWKREVETSDEGQSKTWVDGTPVGEVAK